MARPATRREPRRLWIQLHRWIGLVTMLFLGFAAITGCALCFVRPLDAALNSDLFKGAPVAAPGAVPVLVDRFQAAHPELRVRSFPLNLPADRRIPVKIETADKGAKLGFDQVFLDRATGALVGQRVSKAAWNRRGATELLHDVHYTLLAGKPGRWFFGAIAFAWFVSNLIGAYLTFPLRQPFWKNWKRMWRFSFESSVPRMLLDMHRSSGLWLLIPLTVLAFTSVALNSFTELYEPGVKALVPPRESAFDSPAPHPKGLDGKIGFVRAVERLREEAARQPGGWIPATALYFPARKLYGVTLTDDGTLNYKRLGPVYVYVDSDDGRLVEVDTPYGNPGLSLIRMLYPLHSGRVAGGIGVAVVFLLGLITFGQCGTGLYVWWRKRLTRAT